MAYKNQCRKPAVIALDGKFHCTVYCQRKSGHEGSKHRGFIGNPLGDGNFVSVQWRNEPTEPPTSGAGS